MPNPLHRPPALPASPDTSRRWLWLALLSGLLALLLAGAALTQHPALPTGPAVAAPAPLGGNSQSGPVAHFLAYSAGESFSGLTQSKH